MPTPLRTPHVLLLLLLLAGLLAACSKDKPEPLPYLPSDARILAFGDSLTWGNGAKRDEAYPVVLSKLIDREVVNLATPGDESGDGLEKLPTILDSVQPDLLLLCLGGNDFLRRKSANSTRENLAAMIEAAQARDIPVVLIGVPEPGLLGLKSHPIYAELGKKYKIPVADEIVPELLESKATKSDPIHPNAKGYRLLAEAIAELLRKHGAV